mgnify:CR=1 FL=1
MDDNGQSFARWIVIYVIKLFGRNPQEDQGCREEVLNFFKPYSTFSQLLSGLLEEKLYKRRYSTPFIILYW